MRAITHEIRSAWLPLILGKAFALSCGLLAIPLSTRLIEPETYAFYALFLTLINIGSAIPFAGWIRFVSQTWPTAADRPALAALVLTGISRNAFWFLSIPLASGIALTWLHPHDFWALTLLSLVIANSAMVVGALGTAALQAQKSYWNEFRVTLGSAAARSFLPLMLAAWLGATPAVLAAGIAAHTTIWVLLLPTWRREWHSGTHTPAAPTAPPRRELAIYAFNGLLLWALFAIGRWIVGAFFPQEIAGYFNLAATLAFVLPSALSTTADAIFSPLVYAAAAEARSDADWKKIAHNTDARACLYLGLSIAGAIAVQLIAPFLVGNLIASKYASATHWLLACGFFWATLGTHQYYALLLQAAGLHLRVLKLNTAVLVLVIAGSALTATAGPDRFKLWLVCSPFLLVLSRTFSLGALAKKH